MSEGKFCKKTSGVSSNSLGVFGRMESRFRNKKSTSSDDSGLSSSLLGTAATNNNFERKITESKFHRAATGTSQQDNVSLYSINNRFVTNYCISLTRLFAHLYMKTVLMTARCLNFILKIIHQVRKQ